MFAKYATPSSETAVLLPARKKRKIMKRDSLTILSRAQTQVKIDIGGLHLYTVKPCSPTQTNQVKKRV